MLFFTFSTVVNEITRDTQPLYYKIGFMLEDFALLWTNISVLSMFKVGGAKLGCLVGCYSECIFDLIFQLMMGSSVIEKALYVQNFILK